MEYDQARQERIDQMQAEFVESEKVALLSELLSPQPTVIGIEGGPCSGKTTLAEKIKSQAEGNSRPFVALPEAATIHLNRLAETGRSIVELATGDRPAYLQFQADVVRTIFDNIEQAKAKHAGKDAVILIDRPDIGAYVTPGEYQEVLKMVGRDRSPLQSLVDKLIYLPSVAQENPHTYENLMRTNAARYETSAEQAAAVCAATLQAVQTHPELHVAWGGAFEQKVKYLADMVLKPEVEAELKLKATEEHAFRYIVAAARAGRLLNTMAIAQQYHNVGGQEFRLRHTTGDDGQHHYHFTVKEGRGTVRREIQRTITKEQYTLLDDPNTRIGNILFKDRYVVLDMSDEAGKRRLWFADHYVKPNRGDWHFETDVQSDREADELVRLYEGRRRPVSEADSPRALILK